VLLKINLHPAQARFFESNDRYVLYGGGRPSRGYYNKYIYPWIHKPNPEATKELGKLVKELRMFESKTGAKRSERVVRYDLVPKVFSERVAKRFTGELLVSPHGGDFQAAIDAQSATGGALKYGECNWERGLVTSDTINHIFDHLNSYANFFREMLKMNEGDMSQVATGMQNFSKNEDHLAGAAFGLAVLMYQESQHDMHHDDSFKKPEGFVNQAEPAKEPMYSEGFVRGLENYAKSLEQVVTELKDKLYDLSSKSGRKTRKSRRARK
jgi:hypothetical protein